jgi:DNA-binding LytR/AlgR family response regulator
MKILALDDEPSALHHLEHQCRAILAGRLEQFSVADSGPRAAALLDRQPYDVVLVEPALRTGDCFDLVTAHTRGGCQTIVVSRHPELALRAFDSDVLDFVPKPASRERLARALLRVAPGAAVPAPADHIALRRPGRIELLPVDELSYVVGSDKYSELILVDGRRSFHDQSLGRMEAALPASFVRIHKSYLVRFSLITRLIVQRGSRYFAELKDGQRLPIGRSRYARLKARLL